MTDLECIADAGATLAYLIRRNATSPSTGFFTADDSAFQAGFVVFPADWHVQPHLHLPITRQVVGTSELLVVRSGHCIVDIYADDRRLVASRELLPGDAVLSVGGGHGFRMLQDTVMFEIKQGPYGGPAEKERFDPAPREEGA
jgi:hypothetical protein